MSKNVWLVRTLVVVATSLASPLPCAAHVPWLRAALPELLRGSDCIVAGRVDASEADPRGRGVVLLGQPLSWCGQALPAPLRLRTATARPVGSRFVFFARRDQFGWLDLAPAGVVFPLERTDQQLLHRILITLWKHRPATTPEVWRRAALELLGAQDRTWRYHAAVTLITQQRLGPGLATEERERIQQAARREPDPAVRELLDRITGGALVPER